MAVESPLAIVIPEKMNNILFLIAFLDKELFAVYSC